MGGFSGLMASVILRPYSPCSQSWPPCLLSLPGPSLGSQKALGVLGSLGASDSEALFSLLPSPPEPTRSSETSLGPREAFGSLGASVRLRTLFPLLPCPFVSPHPLSLTGSLEPPWGLGKPLTALDLRLRDLVPFALLAP